MFNLFNNKQTIYNEYTIDELFNKIINDMNDIKLTNDKLLTENIKLKEDIKLVNNKLENENIKINDDIKNVKYKLENNNNNSSIEHIRLKETVRLTNNKLENVRLTNNKLENENIKINEDIINVKYKLENDNNNSAIEHIRLKETVRLTNNKLENDIKQINNKLENNIIIKYNKLKALIDNKMETKYNHRTSYFINKELFAKKFNGLYELNKLVLHIKFNIKFLNIMNNKFMPTSSDIPNLIYDKFMHNNSCVFSMGSYNIFAFYFSKKIGSKYFNQNELNIINLIKSFVMDKHKKNLYDNCNIKKHNFLQPINNEELYNLSNSVLCNNNNKIDRMMHMMRSLHGILISINEKIYNSGNNKIQLDNYTSIPFKNHLLVYSHLSNIQLYTLNTLIDDFTL